MSQAVYLPTLYQGPLGQLKIDATPLVNAVTLEGATQADITLYVDPENGSDSNPGTQAQPLRTIGAINGIVPQEILHAVVVNLAAGNYNEVVNLQFSYDQGGTLQLVGPDLALVTGQSPRTADVSLCSANSIGTPEQGWTKDQWASKWFKITSGTGAGQIAKIGHNDNQKLYLNPDFSLSPIPDGTSVYEIIEPKAVIAGEFTSTFWYNYGLSISGVGSEGQSGVTLQNLAVASKAVFSGSKSFLGSSGVEFRSGVIALSEIGNCYFGVIAFNESILIDGCFIGDNAISGGSTFGGGASVGQVTVVNGVIASELLCLGPSAPSILSSNIIHPANSGSSLLFSDAIGRHYPVLQDVRIDGVNVQGRNSRVKLSGVDISNAGGRALQALYGSYMDLEGVTGTGNYIGATVSDESMLHADNATTISGTNGEIQVGGMVATTWAAIAGTTVYDSTYNAWARRDS